MSFPPQSPSPDDHSRDTLAPRSGAHNDQSTPLTRREARRQRELAAEPENALRPEKTSAAPPEGFPWFVDEAGVDDERDGEWSAVRQRQGRSQNVKRCPQKSKKARWIGLACLAFFASLVVVAGFTLAGPIGAFFAASAPTDYDSDGTGTVVFEIHQGDSGDTIASNLAAAGIIKSRGSFYSLILKQKPPPVFHPGSYPLANQMSARSALAALLNPSNMNKITVPEGTVMSNILQSIAELIGRPRSELDAAAANIGSFGLPAGATSLEGFLFPATYTFMPGSSPHDALQTMVDRMMHALDSAGVAPADRLKTVNLAALIQKEARLPPDFPKISRVFLNRLSAGWKLESDATVSYYTRHDRASTTDAERLDTANPHNTYVYPGLPVGPISNPGDVAINAALHPAAGPWMFFVTVDLKSGETMYSTTNEEHNVAVARWLSWMAANPEFN